MADYHADEQVNVPADQLFGYLSDIANLPKYFDRMTSAKPGDGESVQVSADLGDRQVEGEAWFTVDDEKRMLAWGSEGPNDYHGHLTVSGEGDNSGVAITLSTERGRDRRSAARTRRDGGEHQATCRRRLICRGVT